MDFKKFAENIFKREPRVVFVSIVDNRYTVLANEMRKGATLYYTPEFIRNFVQLVPLIVMDALEKLKLALGPISSVTVRYEKRVLLFSRYEDMIVVLGLEPSVPTPLPDSMAKLIEETAKQST